MATASSSSVMPSVTSRSQLGADEPLDLAGVVGHRAGVHRPRAGVGVGRRRRVHAVGEAAALADLVEQAARQAAAEHVVDDVEGLAVGIVACAPSGRRWRGGPARSRRRSRRLLGRARARRGRCARRPSAGRRTPPSPRRPPRRGRRRRRRRSSWRRRGSARRRTRGCRRRRSTTTVSRSPAVSRPRPWSPNSWRARVRRATSSGESSSIASSSRMTWRSLSTSSSASSERVRTSPSSSTPVPA